MQAAIEFSKIGTCQGGDSLSTLIRRRRFFPLYPRVKWVHSQVGADYPDAAILALFSSLALTSESPSLDYPPVPHLLIYQAVVRPAYGTAESPR